MTRLDTSVVDADPAEPGRPPTAIPARGIAWWRWLPAVTALAGIVAVLVWRNTSPVDVVRYAVYVAWGLALPGVLIYRALRRTPHSLVDDLAMGTALGFALELAAWAGYAAAGQQRLLWTWPAAVVTIFVLVPGLRRHWRRPEGYVRAPLAWSWVLAAVVVALMVYIGATFLRYQPTPTAPHEYYLDFPYLLSLVGEAKHHFPLHTPQVAGEPLHYHWFAYAHMASASLISGVSAPVVFFRLALPVICAVSVVLTAVVGWRVSGRPWVGAVAAALMYVIGEATLNDYLFLGLIGRWIIYSSPSASYAWLATFPLILVAVDRIRRNGLPGAGIGPAAWPLLAVFAALASAAKSTVLPVVIAGLGLAGLVQLLQRRFPWRIVAAGAIVCGVLVTATAVVFGFESYGMSWHPFAIFEPYIPPSPHRSPVKAVALLGVGGAAYTAYMLARMAGVPVLAWLSSRRRGAPGGSSRAGVTTHADGDPDSGWSVTEWLLLGGLLAGLAGTLLLGHPAWSQTYLLRTGWAFGVILSAMGYVALVQRHRIPTRVLVGILVGAVLLAFAIDQVVLDVGSATGVGWRGFRPIFWTVLGVVAVATAIGIGWSVVRRRWRWHTGIGVVTALSLVLAMGVPVTIRETYGALTSPAAESAFYADRVGPDQIAVADFLRANSTPDQVVATNAHCPSGDKSPPASCLHLTFWLSAWSERRTLVSGWGYVPRAVDEAATAKTFPGNTPFWDAHLLAVNENAFYHPTPAGLAELRDRYSVRWLVVDRSTGPESADLARLATLRLQRGDLAVYRLS